MPWREQPGESVPRRKRDQGRSADTEADYLLEATEENWPHILAAYKQFAGKKPVVLFELHS